MSKLSFHISAASATLLAVAVIALFLLAAASVLCQQTEDYKLGPEDVISVTVMGHPDLSGDFLVPTDGKIDIQRAGEISVAGKTTRETAQVVAKGLSDTLMDPDVVVALKTMRPQLVQVLGAVQKPGAYPAKPGWRLTEAIGAAGGIVPEVQPADCTVSVLRSSAARKESIPLAAALQGGEGNTAIGPGDVVTIESVETIPVYVMGKVHSPGMYNLRTASAGVIEALAMAGGATEDAALSQVAVTHLTGETKVVDVLAAMEDKKQLPLKLRSGDLVVVSENKARFAVMGWVANPGFFILKEGQRICLSDALSMAGGADTKRGGLKQIGLIRITDGKEQRLVFDFGKYTRKADASQNPEIHKGDLVWVPETGAPDSDKVWARVTGALSSLWFLR